MQCKSGARPCWLSTESACCTMTATSFCLCIITTAQVLWQSLRKCKKPIGLVLMTQEMVAGIGRGARQAGPAVAGYIAQATCKRHPDG